MVVHLHGLFSYDFKNDDGERVVGTNLFISFHDGDVVGERTDKLSLKAGFDLPPVKPGDILNVDYNNKGKAVSITVVNK